MISQNGTWNACWRYNAVVAHRVGVEENSYKISRSCAFVVVALIKANEIEEMKPVLRRTKHVENQGRTWNRRVLCVL